MPRRKVVIAPHKYCYCIVKPSPLHGVGVFAIRDIPKGVDPFSDTDNELCIKVSKKKIRSFPAWARVLYNHYVPYCPTDKIECPKTFNMMSLIWYLNHSKAPNLVSKDAWTYKTTRRIHAHEELLINYDDVESIIPR